MDGLWTGDQGVPLKIPRPCGLAKTSGRPNGRGFVLSSMLRMDSTREIAVGSLRLGGANLLFLIAGPCVIESEAHARKMAEQVARTAADAGMRA